MTRGNAVRLAAAKRNKGVINMLLALKEKKQLSNNALALTLNEQGVKSSGGGKFTSTSIKRYLDQAKILKMEAMGETHNG